MRRILFLFLLVAFSMPTWARSKANVTILSYQELMSLSPKVRMTYLSDLAKLMARMEKRQSQFEVANTELQDMQEQVATLMREFAPLAEAEAAGTAKSKPVPTAPDLPQAPMPGQGSSLTVGQTCVSKAFPLIYDSRVGTCVLSDPSHPKLAAVVKSANGCPSGAVAVTNPAGGTATVICASKAEWDKLPAQHRTAVMRRERWDARSATVVREKTKISTGSAVMDPTRSQSVAPAASAAPEAARQSARPDAAYNSGSGPSNGGAVNPAPSVAEPVQNKGPDVSIPRGSSPSRPYGSVAPRADSLPLPLGIGTGGASGAPPVAGGQSPQQFDPLGNPAQNPAQNPEDAAAAAADPQPASVEAENAAVNTCGAEAFTCKNIDTLKAEGGEAYKSALKQIEAFRKSGKDNVCIWGGFFSKYPSAKKKKNSCAPVRSFGNLKCDPPDGKTKGQLTMCNPVLFCLQSDQGVQVHCVPFGKSAGYDITRRCQDWYNKVTSTGESKLNGVEAPVKTQRCDPGTIKFGQGLDNLQNSWNELKRDGDEKFAKYCDPVNGDKDFQALFCDECRAMADIRAKTGQCGTVATAAPAAPAPQEPGGESTQAIPETQKRAQ